MHISLLELPATVGTSLDVADPENPTTNALHLRRPETKNAVDTGPEIAP